MSSCANPALVQPTDLTVAAVRSRMAPYQSRIDELKRRYPTRRAVLLQVLHLAQQEFGWVPRVAIEWAAEVSETSAVHAFSVVEFYTMYRQAPRGRYLVQVCQTMCCHIQGAEDLIEHIEAKLGIHAGETTADGVFSLVRVECLALCGSGPGVMIDDQAIGPVPHPLNQPGKLRETHLDGADFHPGAAHLDAWIDFLRADAAKNPKPKRHHEHDALGDLMLNTKGHPQGQGASAQPVQADYAPPAPALKVAAKVEAGAVALTWLNDPNFTAKAVVERSDDNGTTWREIASVGPKDQKASDKLEAGKIAQYRVIAHEKTRVARPSAAVTATGA
ncbi:MAG: NAD(P)H-dependent oxidoreductase subunit E [Planctomycetota bacterium]